MESTVCGGFPGRFRPNGNWHAVEKRRDTGYNIHKYESERVEKMKYYMLEGSFVGRLPEQGELKKAIDAHLAYLQTGFQDGSVLVSGPKAGGGGGVIVLKSDDIEKFCREDPLVQAGIQKYRITEFKLHRCQDSLKSWFQQ